MQHTFPVVQILLTKGNIEIVGVAGRLYVGGGSTVTQHLQNGITGNKVDQEKDQRYDEPYDGQGVQHAEREIAEHLVDGRQIQASGLRLQVSGFRSEV